MAMAERSTSEQLKELHQEMQDRYDEAVRRFHLSRAESENSDDCPVFYDYQTWLEIEFESLEEILNS